MRFVGVLSFGKIEAKSHGGVSAELAHFLDDQPLEAEITPDDAYHIARILWAAEDNEEALDLARRAVGLIEAPTPAETARWEDEGGLAH